MKHPRFWTLALSAIAVAICTIPAFSQEGTSFRFTWEINLTTLCVVVGAATTWYLTITRQGDKVAKHAETIATLKTELATKVEADALKKLSESVDSLRFKTSAMEVQHNALKDEVYKEYLSVRAFDKIKNELRDDAHQTKQELMDAINGLSGRIDNLASVRSGAH